MVRRLEFPARQRPRVVIVGGGFGGLNAAKVLGGAPVDVALFDRTNYHLFQPLLYQVATAALSPAEIAEPIRRILSRHRNIRVYLNGVRAVDVERRLVAHEGGEAGYDYLVVATGATHSYFGREEWAAHAPGLKTIDDAVEIRRRVLLSYEEAEQEADAEARRAKLTFVVVGAGPTGVELAGALQEIAARTIPRDFRNIDTSTARVVLLEGAARVLPGMDPVLSARARRDLERLGVEVRTGAVVTGVEAGGVRIGDQFLLAENVLWAAGVQASPLGRSLGVQLDRRGRVPVGPDLSLPGHPEVFVIGDLAKIPDPRYPDGLPGVAQVAIQGGRHVARIIAREVGGDARGGARPAFRYRDKGTLATIGRNRAVAEIGRLRLAGWPAWVLWGLVHILFLISFRAKVAVMWDWLWNYVFYAKGARLITGSPRLKVKRVLREEEVAALDARDSSAGP
ncbi:MAG TPA: NAD(P)/FAD-dependent oxidoreductase [Candidatus Krumholzibacteria bacterium]|nr:NAD(P)/FAD-dependent oxidoreductase [Candidatus Krumholzibacteria bacterium]HPD71933.1 NAD(P)/FAD-dependent oxidoreductase [Candidatus Krumholzibacteria bacterium]HRY41134.1 NAD(P)/FAD-dependent oxidoreductase [Candidatus Krumholzibacteria bacterium]